MGGIATTRVLITLNSVMLLIARYRQSLTVKMLMSVNAETQLFSLKSHTLMCQERLKRNGFLVERGRFQKCCREFISNREPGRRNMLTYWGPELWRKLAHRARYVLEILILWPFLPSSLLLRQPHSTE